MTEPQVHGFEAEVSKLLRLLAKSLYSNKEVFLRELVSNASDAIDKLRFKSITEPELTKDDPVLSIRIRADKEAGTLTISDNGVGMTLEDANAHLGTIAKSGTEEFVKNLTGDAAKDAQLIGQFGVGFYSAFIVADRVTVTSRAAGAAEDAAVEWTSEGEGTYASRNVTRAARGTDVTLHLKPEEHEFLDEWRIREIVSKYSDHIATPVYLYVERPAAKKDEDADDNTVEATVGEWVQVNDAKALWTLNPREVKDEDYKTFYRHLTHAYDEPLCWAHNRVEGELEYTSLLYVPGEAPWDLYERDADEGLKLYVERVFIMDKADAFLPRYLRFIRGLVDTNDLPLNVSRELLQESAVTRKLKRALTKRALGMLEKLADNQDDKEKYARFWSAFGKVLKEGVVEDPSNRETILKLLRFASSASGSAEETVSLKDYLERAPKEQKHIYYLTAGTYAAAASSPYLETLKKKGVEVLLLSERIDEWMMGSITEFEGHRFVSASAEDLELGDLEKEEEKKEAEEAKKSGAEAVARFKAALGDKVEGVSVSTRLVDSPACVVSKNDQTLTAEMRRMLTAMGRPVPEEKWSLEVNPSHPLVAKALAEKDPARFDEWAQVLLDQALLADQGTLENPAGFVKRLTDLLLK